MSDVFQGPGWWLASDGLWYEPSTHPDASYREAFEALEAEREAAAQFDEHSAFGDFPSVEIVLPEEARALEDADSPSVIRTASQRSEATTGALDTVEDEAIESDVEQPLTVGSGAAASGSGAWGPLDPPPVPDLAKQNPPGASDDETPDDDRDETSIDGHADREERDVRETSADSDDTEDDDREDSEDLEDDDTVAVADTAEVADASDVAEPTNQFAAPLVTPHLETGELDADEFGAGQDDGWVSGWSPISTSAADTVEPEFGSDEATNRATVAATGSSSTDLDDAALDTTVGDQDVTASVLDDESEDATSESEAPKFPQRVGRRSATQATERAGDVDAPFGVEIPGVDDVATSPSADESVDAAAAERPAGDASNSPVSNSPTAAGTSFADNELVDFDEDADGPAPMPIRPVSRPSGDDDASIARSTKNGGRSQSAALEQARRERLAQAQKAAERMRDKARGERTSDDMAFVSEFESVSEAQTGSTPSSTSISSSTKSGMRPPGAPGGPVASSPSSESSDAAVADPPSVAGRTKLEIQSNDSDGARPGSLGLAPPVEVSTTTDLIHVPSDEKTPVDILDRILAFVVFVSGLAMIVGTFLNWTTGPGDEVGWDRPDGIVAVVAGVVAATASGPLFVGIRFISRPVAIVAGVVAVMVAGVVGVTTLTESETTGLMLGAGLFTVFAGGIGAIIAAVAMRSDRPY